ncbi:MAG: MOSC domain-containing protein [Chloroflexota bacterium]
MDTVMHLSMNELETGMEIIRQSPKDDGTLKMIVRRPQDDEREIVNEAELNLTDGMAGDNWKSRGSKHTVDGSALLDAQITVMNARIIALVAQNEERWSLAGDQLYVDLDLSQDNLPAGTRLAIGSAVIEVSAVPHTGCRKFSARFGTEAIKFVNSEEGKQLRLRGINAKVVQAGTIRVGDVVRKM